jgi:hypothetical protein
MSEMKGESIIPFPRTESLVHLVISCRMYDHEFIELTDKIYHPILACDYMWIQAKIETI